MSVTAHRPARLSIRRRFGRTTTPSITEGDDSTYREVYEMLSDAAHLLTHATRRMRYAKQKDAELALQGLADDIHENIRRLPAATRYRTPARPRQRRASSDR